MKNLLRQYLSDSDFRMTVYSCEHNGIYETHSHRDFYELVIVRSGKADQIIGNFKQRLRGGNIFVIPPHIEHRYEHAEKFEIYNVLFSTNFFKYFEYDLRNSVNYHLLFPQRDANENEKKNFVPEILRLDGKSFFELDRLAKDIEEELELSLIGSRVGALSNFLKIMLLLIRNAEPINDRFEKDKNLRNIGKLITALDSKYMDKWSIASMAKFCGMQVNNFRFKFKEHTGLSPVNYLMKLRIEKAAALLLFSDMNVSEIALVVGFDDSNYFSRQFNKYIGRSPRAFIKGRR
jgi:AraC-like DNA-binding protein/quercetin dioxygenase-like cupin family protein